MALGRDDWIDAGLAALAEGGLAAVAVDPLARRLGATKGSFYWHFANRDELIAAVLEQWEQRDTADVIASLEAIPDPRVRLVELTRRAYRASARGGDVHSAVAAAGGDPRVAPVLERVTHARLAALERLFADTGLDPTAARRRARLAYALYLGVAALPRAPEDEVEAEIELMIEALGE